MIIKNIKILDKNKRNDKFESEIKKYIEETFKDYSFEEGVFSREEFITNCNIKLKDSIFSIEYQFIYV